ncbi:iron transporter [uncultured Treponema sp.]|uniref:iron transporter n=1 Tax=uncultured Treponema sp. TaxID=162155 RepID=UPI0025FBF1F7|nr:iron transporter [uncultured Treponema sp.]
MKKTAFLVFVAAFLSVMACKEKKIEETSSQQENEEVVEDGVEAEEGDFIENSIGEEQQVAFLSVSAFYFHAVDMKSGEGNTQKGSDFTMHIEADIIALENDLGYIVDQFVPFLTIGYEILEQSSGSVLSKGRLMPMNASDGPHYGANINLSKAGTYTLRLIIHSPAENNYFIHTDKDTMPGAVLQKYWPEDKPLKVEFTDWVFDGKKVQ